MNRLIVFIVEHCRVHSLYKNIAKIVIYSKLVEFHNQLTSVCVIRSKNDLKMHAHHSIFRMNHTHHNYLLGSSHL